MLTALMAHHELRETFRHHDLSSEHCILLGQQQYKVLGNDSFPGRERND